MLFGKGSTFTKGSRIHRCLAPTDFSNTSPSSEASHVPGNFGRFLILRCFQSGSAALNRLEQQREHRRHRRTFGSQTWLQCFIGRSVETTVNQSLGDCRGKTHQMWNFELRFQDLHITSFQCIRGPPPRQTCPTFGHAALCRERPT